MNQPDQASPAPKNNRQRNRILLVLALAFATGGAIWGGWWYLHGRFHVHTDDAYVAGNVVEVTAQVPGRVEAIRADDTDKVDAGAELIHIDPVDARLALDRTEAELAQAIRKAATLYTDRDALAAQVRLRQAELGKAREDLARRQKIETSGAVATEELAHGRADVATGEAALAHAQEMLAGNRALTRDVTVADHPDVLAAAARMEAAWVNLARTRVLAPVSGFVARRTVQPGQQVAVGAPLLAVVPLHQVWVEANFKEPQLKNVRVGQAAKVTSDLYGSSIVWHGKVVGLSAGTGAAFALLPPQNASGNWIKVVQRLPVRIALDPKELAEHPLRLGLSLNVEVNIGDSEGAKAPDAAIASPNTADVYGNLARAAHGYSQAFIAAAVAGKPSPAEPALP